ncbi:MAG: hypothetical protein H6738_20200 [Alphaproteobacteria bacterium]|nr:hypothetical protein [Alphaproteobacteria bacterium]
MRDRFLAIAPHPEALDVWTDQVELLGHPGWGAVLGARRLASIAEGLAVACPQAVVRRETRAPALGHDPTHLWWAPRRPERLEQLAPWLALDPVVHVVPDEPWLVPAALEALGRVAPWLTRLDVQHPVAPDALHTLSGLRALATVASAFGHAPELALQSLHLRCDDRGHLGGWTRIGLPALTDLRLVYDRPLRGRNTRQDADLIASRAVLERLDLQAPEWPPALHFLTLLHPDARPIDIVCRGAGCERAADDLRSVHRVRVEPPEHPRAEVEVVAL